MSSAIFLSNQGGSITLVGTDTPTTYLLQIPASNGSLLFQDSTNTARLINVAITGTTSLSGFSSSADAQFTSNGAIGVPSGTTAQRPQTPYYGQIRYNSELTDYEGYTPLGWASLGGGATQGVTSVNGQIGAVVLNYTNVQAAPQTSTVSAGTGLTGGGLVSANPSLSIAPTGITAKAYGDNYQTNLITVNAQGQITAVSETTILIKGSTQLSDYGTTNGVATLDANGKLTASQVPTSILSNLIYKGAWNASTNTPTLTSSVGTAGNYYIVAVAGNTNLNGITNWLVGDWALFNGTVWEQVTYDAGVQSVNGYTGAVTLTYTDVGAVPTTRILTAGTGLSGGGALSSNITLSIPTSGVTPASYVLANLTVNAQGIVTSASNGNSTSVTNALGYTPANINGTNATGTWPISISGNSATSTLATNATNAASCSGNAVTATTASAVATTNFEITQSNGKLYFSYNENPIASLDSSGNFTCIGNITAAGSP
jgi:hypothetical protein